jgi:hypothetical protein
MKAMQAGAMNWKRSFEQSSLRYIFITMRLRLSAVFGDRQRVDKNFMLQGSASKSG